VCRVVRPGRRQVRASRLHDGPDPWPPARQAAADDEVALRQVFTDLGARRAPAHPSRTRRLVEPRLDRGGVLDLLTTAPTPHAMRELGSDAPTWRSTLLPRS
jgi:hypothetical protein